MTKYYGVKEFSEISGLPQCAIRELASGKKPHLKSINVGKKLYIVVEENSITDELMQKVAKQEQIIMKMCTHFGVSFDEGLVI